MNLLLDILILLFGVSSYVVGSLQILQNKYRPNTFSRSVWLLIAINSFAGVVASHSSRASVLLAGVLLAGNALIFLLSLWKGTRTIGQLEYVCLALLCISLAIWIFFKTPLVNLSLSLLAHLVGATPTLQRVWHEPRLESSGFWSLFFIASLLSIAASSGSLVKAILPIYFACFDGTMFFLSLGKAPEYRPKQLHLTG